jgi:hypothetical protein
MTRLNGLSQWVDGMGPLLSQKKLTLVPLFLGMCYLLRFLVPALYLNMTFCSYQSTSYASQLWDNTIVTAPVYSFGKKKFRQGWDHPWVFWPDSGLNSSSMEGQEKLCLLSPGCLSSIYLLLSRLLMPWKKITPLFSATDGGISRIAVTVPDCLWAWGSDATAELSFCRLQFELFGSQTSRRSMISAPSP